MSLQEKIKKLNQLGITQKSIAKRCGYSAIYISQFLAGERKISERCEKSIQDSLDQFLLEITEVINNE